LASVASACKWLFANCEENRVRSRLFAVGGRNRFDSTSRTQHLLSVECGAGMLLPTFSKDCRELSRAADIYNCNRETNHRSWGTFAKESIFDVPVKFHIDAAQGVCRRLVVCAEFPTAECPTDRRE
jgi:hypothetical protein